MTEARKEYVCIECGCIIEDENKVVIANGECFCDECANSVLIECEECGELHRINDMYRVVSEADDLKEWCPECFEKYAFTCERCGGAYDSRYHSEHTVSNGSMLETWCEDCTDNDAVICRECGELVCEDDAHYVSDVADYVCDDCINDGYTVCDRCGEYHRNDDMYFDSTGYYHVCENCAENSRSWYYCEECGRYVYEDDWDSDMEMCYDCRNELSGGGNAFVREYGCDPSLIYFGENPEPLKPFCGTGIELEIDSEESLGRDKQNCLNALDELLGDHAYYKHDGSLRHGFEIVTMPHTIEEFYKLPWDKVLDTCKTWGFSSHEIGTCGLHMHVSRTMFGEDEEEQSDNIAKMMQFYEMYWLDILKVSRRTEEQAQQWARRYMRVRKESLKNFAKHKEHCDRYMAVNVTNSATVEIRINRGTLKLKSFLATCDFILTTCQNASKIDWADVSDDFLWLKGLKKETLQYLSERSAFNEPTWKYLQEIQIAEHDALMAELEERRREAEAQEFNTDDSPFDDEFDEALEFVTTDEFDSFVQEAYESLRALSF